MFTWCLVAVTELYAIEVRVSKFQFHINWTDFMSPMLKRYLQSDYFFRQICSRPQRTDIFNLRAKSKEGFKESLSINTAHSVDHSVGKRNSYLCVQPLTSIQRVECSSNSYIDSQECEERRMDINGKLSGWYRSNIGMKSVLWPRYLFVGLVIKQHAN